MNTDTNAEQLAENKEVVEETEIVSKADPLSEEEKVNQECAHKINEILAAYNRQIDVALVLRAGSTTPIVNIVKKKS